VRVHIRQGEAHERWRRGGAGRAKIWVCPWKKEQSKGKQQAGVGEKRKKCQGRPTGIADMHDLTEKRRE